MATTHSKPFGFFDLLRELRNKVYTNLTNDVPQYHTGISAAISVALENGPAIKMLQVCRQFRKEYAEEVLLSMEISLVFYVKSPNFAINSTRGRLQSGHLGILGAAGSVHAPRVSDARNWRIELELCGRRFGKGKYLPEQAVELEGSCRKSAAANVSTAHVEYLEKLLNSNRDRFRSVRSVTMVLDARVASEDDFDRVQNKQMNLFPFVKLALPIVETTRQHVLKARLCQANMLDQSLDGWDRCWKNRRKELDRVSYLAVGGAGLVDCNGSSSLGVWRSDLKTIEECERCLV